MLAMPFSAWRRSRIGDRDRSASPATLARDVYPVLRRGSLSCRPPAPTMSPRLAEPGVPDTAVDARPPCSIRMPLLPARFMPL